MSLLLPSGEHLRLLPLSNRVKELWGIRDSGQGVLTNAERIVSDNEIDTLQNRLQPPCNYFLHRPNVR